MINDEIIFLQISRKKNEMCKYFYNLIEVYTRYVLIESMNEQYGANGPEKASEMEVALLYSGVCAWLQNKPVCIDESGDSGGQSMPRLIDGIIVASDHSPHHTVYIDGDLVKKYAPGPAEELEIRDLDMLGLSYVPLHYAEAGLDESFETTDVPPDAEAVSIVECSPSLEIQISNSERLREWLIAPPGLHNSLYDTRYTEELASCSFEREYFLADEAAAFEGILRHLAAMHHDMG